MSEKASIIICHHNQPDHLNLLIQSLRLCSKNNEYEIIVVDNNSNEQSKPLFEFLNATDNIQLIQLDEPVGYTNSLLEGYKYISKDSGYVVFSHSDNVILNAQWLDFLIENQMDNQNCGGICIGPTVRYTGPNNKEVVGPNYNFLFSEVDLFNSLQGFKFSNCNNIGSILGYQYQLQQVNKQIVTVSSEGFIHHYFAGSISTDQKVEDVQKLNKLLIESL